MILEQVLVTYIFGEKNMNITIAESLRMFRKECGNTQEDFSSYIRISTQAVLKWERGEGYPDITLMPLISAYYEKTVNKLPGYGEIERNRKIEELGKQYREKWKAGRIEEDAFPKIMEA